MKITEGKFPKIVVAEATKLRELATTTEKFALSYDSLHTNSRYKCIYGQLTGDCHSKRAEELIKASCSRIYIPNGDPHLSTKLNGSPKKMKRIKNWKVKFWSPIEVFIAQVSRSSYPELNKMLIEFIKGQRESLPVK